jgi:UDP-N-acetylglucosamine 2-epimerase
LREGAFLGTPAVTIGTRQQNRETGRNVIEVPNDRAAIRDAIRVQLDSGRYERDKVFGDGTAGLKIADALAGETPPVQKVLTYDTDALLERAAPAVA